MDLFELKRFAIVTVGSRTALYFFQKKMLTKWIDAGKLS